MTEKIENDVWKRKCRIREKRIGQDRTGQSMAWKLIQKDRREKLDIGREMRERSDVWRKGVEAEEQEKEREKREGGRSRGEEGGRE